MRIVELIFAASLLIPAVARTADQNVDIRSDSLEVDHENRRALFEGNVEAVYGELNLRCDRIRVEYTEEGAIRALLAEGRVAVRKGDARATADRARLEVKQRLLVLSGSPVLIKGPHRVEGSRVEVQLGSGEIRVIEARGLFRLDLGGAD